MALTRRTTSIHQRCSAPTDEVVATRHIATFTEVYARKERTRRCGVAINSNATEKETQRNISASRMLAASLAGLCLLMRWTAG